MTLVEQEKKRREQEERNGRSSRIAPPTNTVLTPANAQNPPVYADSTNNSRAPRPAASPVSYGKQEPAATPTPSRTPAPQVTPTRTRGASVDAFDPSSGKERPKPLGFYAGWWRDRVNENLTDADGDGRYEIPFWWGVGNSITDAVGLSDRSNREIAENRRNQERDQQARAIARSSGVQDQIPMDENRLYDPDRIQGRVNQITRNREVGDAEDVQQQELEVIDRSNAPTLEQIASGERQNRETNRSNETIARDANQSAETMNSENNSTTRRGQDNDRDISILGMDNELDLAEIQRLANQDTIQSQNQLAQQQYAMQLEMYNLDRQDRKDERRQDSLSALLAGLAALGASFSM